MELTIEQNAVRCNIDQGTGCVDILDSDSDVVQALHTELLTQIG